LSPGNLPSPYCQLLICTKAQVARDIQVKYGVNRSRFRPSLGAPVQTRWVSAPGSSSPKAASSTTAMFWDEIS
jgi:hypothetical protein